MAALYEDALVYETGSAITSTGALTAYSGAKTGRSPLDKRIVKEESSEKDVWWGPVNKAMAPEVSIEFALWDAVNVTFGHLLWRTCDGLGTGCSRPRLIPRMRAPE